MDRDDKHAKFLEKHETKIGDDGKQENLYYKEKEVKNDLDTQKQTKEIMSKFKAKLGENDSLFKSLANEQ